MRYLNWDVLLFPEDGDEKTPLQEFSTACIVTQDPALDSNSIPMPGCPTYFKTVGHPLPTVTAFVPSLLPGTPFRVSLHSWATPGASRATQSMVAQGNSVWFEANVYIDGVCSAGILFSQDPSWPQIIDQGFPADQDNKHEQLRFPLFHPESLSQIWANPGQGMGTVRIVIAEGINQGQADNVVFLRLRNIVTFSFQHAPLHTLENVGIAWPNPGMWWQAQQQFADAFSPRNGGGDPDAHAHSPRRRQASKEVFHSLANQGIAPPHMSQGLMGHPAFRSQNARGGDPFWSQHGPMHDSFMGAVASSGFYKTDGTRSTVSGDIPMPDQSRSASISLDESIKDYPRPTSPGSSRRSYSMPDYSREPSHASSLRSLPMPDYSHPSTLAGSRVGSDVAITAMTELGLSRRETMLQPHGGHDTESHFNDMMAAFSPRRYSNTSGISAPSNTRVSSAINTPLVQNGEMSAAAQERAASYTGHPRSVSVTTRDPPPSAAKVSRNETKSPLNLKANFSPEAAGKSADMDSQPGATIKKKPVGKPKGRKEGRSSEIGGLEVCINKSQRNASTGTLSNQGKENNTTAAEKSSDGKRKRMISISGSKAVLDDRLGDKLGSSPTRKVSKTGAKESPSKIIVDLDDLTAEGVVTRFPLGELENCM